MSGWFGSFRICASIEGVVRGASASVTGARYVVGLVTRVVTEQDLVVSSARMSSRPGLEV